MTHTELQGTVPPKKNTAGSVLVVGRLGVPYCSSQSFWSVLPLSRRDPMAPHLPGPTCSYHSLWLLNWDSVPNSASLDMGEPEIQSQKHWDSRYPPENSTAATGCCDPQRGFPVIQRIDSWLRPEEEKKKNHFCLQIPAVNPPDLKLLLLKTQTVSVPLCHSTTLPTSAIQKHV